MFNTNGQNYSLADIAAATNNNDTMWGGNGGWWIILLFLFIFAGGWGSANGGLWGGSNATASGITDGYILTSDFASLERQMDNGFDGIRQQGTQIANGISSLGYDQLGQMNNINTNINNATNSILTTMNTNTNALNANITGLGNQMASCCCEQKTLAQQNAAELNYRLAQQSCQTRQTVNDAAAAITAGADANTRSILAAIQGMQTQALQDKITALTADNQALKFAASQQAQNAYLVGALSPTPVPAYTVPNPYTGTYYKSCQCCG